MAETLLEIQDLHVEFRTEEGIVPAVAGVSFKINKGETVALVGESGCGKSVTALSIMRLLPEPQARITKGKILFNGKDLVKASQAEMRKIRGNAISMVFQEPMTSLNPVFTVGMQVMEAIMLHQKVTEAQAWRQAVDMFKRVGIPDPETRMRQYPHQLSGGLRQRVMIAMALSCRPQLLIADEPTTALDVTIQAQILDLMRELRDEFGMSILFITHDLGVVAEMAERVVVMYSGEAVEEAPVHELYANPKHPYTKGLLTSIPRLDTQRKTLLPAIEGVVPRPQDRPKGCPFAPRCPYVMDICRSEHPDMVAVGEAHMARCWLYPDKKEAAS
ncbi:MAG: ABC transporter ATP-binding protein [Clostridiales bacterium]|nr:ABC transporter ATP-binding protein [Clostridiales bacterium]